MDQSELRCNDHDEVCFGVCINSNCTKKRQVCYKCLKNLHTSHMDDIIDMEQFQLLKQDSQKFQEEISQTINSIQQMVNQLGQLIRFTFPDDPATLKEIELQVFQMNKLNHLKDNVSQSIKLVQKTIESFHNDLKQCLNVNEEKEKKGDQFETFQFSNSDKSEYIVLSENNLEAEGYKECFCTPMISQNQKKQFAFKVLRLGVLQSIFLGVCNKEQMAKNFNPWNTLTEIGHGLYVIEYLGFCYSSHQEQKNCKQLSFEFEKDDIIAIEVDNLNHQITWKKITTGETFVIKIIFQVLDLQEQQDFHPFIYIGGNAKVQILNNEL